LGAGQALKYAAIFGELIADLIIEQKIAVDCIDIIEFSISRFIDQDLSGYWQAGSLKNL
jgi:sarcosine oxidase subunit beta